MVKIDITGQPTGLSLYEVWEAVVALASTCVRGRQKCGKAAGLGSYTIVEVRARWLMVSGVGRNIFLQLSDEHPDATTQPLSIGSQNLSFLTSGEGIAR